MKVKSGWVFLAAAVLVVSFDLKGQGFESYWKNGYHMESADKQFRMKFGGRLMYDMVFYFQDDSLENAYGRLNNGTEFRRARLYNSGEIYGNTGYKVQLDFAGGKIAFKDVYIELKDLPGRSSVRAGQFKEPFRLEVLTSSNYITFMERSFPLALSPERSNGVMTASETVKNRMVVQGGIFRGSDESGNSVAANDQYALTGRVAGTPLAKDGNLVHLGASCSYRRPDPHEYSAYSRAEEHLGHKYVNTGTLPGVKAVILAGFEGAAVYGPLSIQGDYVTAAVDRDSVVNRFGAYYVQAGWFITGEKRVYKSAAEGFGRNVPEKNFTSGGGPGGWELVVRYGAIDLDDGSVKGGRMAALTAGLNWYLNPSVRVMMNYVTAEVADEGRTGVFQVRMQVEF